MFLCAFVRRLTKMEQIKVLARQLAPLGNTAQRLWLTARPFAVEKRAQEMIVALALEISTVRGPYGMKADSFAGLVP